MFYREQKWKSRKTKNLKVKESLEFLDVKIYPVLDLREKKKSRKEKNKVTEPKQKKLNTKRSLEWHKKLVHCNFDESDYVIHATFNNKNRPEGKEAVDKEFKNYISRINRRRKKEKLDNCKYIAVVENGKRGKVHFHIIIDSDLHRDVLEELWNKKGYINVDRLQANEEGFAALVTYMAKEHKKKNEEGKHLKSWRSSLGLKKPEVTTNDNRYSNRKVEKMVFEQPSREELEKKYPGYILTKYNISRNDEYGLIYVEINMRKHCKNEKIPGTKNYKARRN